MGELLFINQSVGSLALEAGKALNGVGRLLLGDYEGLEAALPTSFENMSTHTRPILTLT